MRADLIPAIQESIRNDPAFNMSDWSHCIAAHIVNVGAAQIPHTRYAVGWTAANAMAILEIPLKRLRGCSSEVTGQGRLSALLRRMLRSNGSISLWPRTRKTMHTSTYQNPNPNQN